MFRVWWDQKGVVFMSYWSLAKRLIPNQQLTDLNRSLLKKKTTKREYQNRQHKVIFLHDNAPSHTVNQFGTRWNHSAGKFYPMRLTHQTWLLPITTYLHRWVTNLLSSALVRRCEKIARWMVRSKRGRIFTGVVSTNCSKDGKNV